MVPYKKNIRQVGVHSPPPIHESRPLIVSQLNQQYKGTELPRHTQTFFKVFINMAEILSPMSGDDLRNNYEFKVVRRALMKQYPWIKDVTFNEDELNKYNLIFLQIIVDPIEMGEAFGYELNSWIQGRLDRGEKYHGTFPSLIFNIPFENGKSEVTKPIDDMIREIHNSPALPEDLRLPRGRQFQVGHYIFNPDGKEW